MILSAAMLALVMPLSAASVGAYAQTVGATGVTVDNSGNVYIVDTGNNRVLEFPSSCAATGCSATRVFGQVEFAMISAYQAHTALSVGTRPATTGANLDSPAEVAVDSNGNVYAMQLTGAPRPSRLPHPG